VIGRCPSQVTEARRTVAVRYFDPAAGSVLATPSDGACHSPASLTELHRFTGAADSRVLVHHFVGNVGGMWFPTARIAPLQSASLSNV